MEPGGLQSVGSQRVGHDRGDLAQHINQLEHTICLIHILNVFLSKQYLHTLINQCQITCYYKNVLKSVHV